MNNSIFTNKVIVVTGASEGIGRALCLQLAPQKPKLVLAARNVSRLESLQQALNNLNVETVVVPTDVTSEADCKKLIDATIEQFGVLDVLVNNAGGTMWTTLEDIEDLSLYEHLMRLNYLSCVYCTSYALPYLKQSKGLIVGVSSAAGLTGVPCRTGYAAAKHAVFGFFDSLRIELRNTGVDILMVAPDFVQSEIHKRAIGKNSQALGFNPLAQNKVMTAEQCADMMVDAMASRKRLLLTSGRSKLARWIKLFFPGLVDKLAAKAIQQGAVD